MAYVTALLLRNSPTMRKTRDISQLLLKRVTFKPPVISQTKTMSIFRWKPDINTIFKKDKVGVDCAIIYNNNYRWYLTSSYAVLTPSVAIAFFSAAYQYDEFLNNMPISDLDHTLAPTLLGGFFCTFLWLGTFLLMRRCFIRIYFHEKANQFIGMRFNWRLGLSQVRFGLEDVTGVRQQSSLFQEMSGNIRVRHRPFYITRKDFTSPRFYNAIMTKAKANPE